MWCESVPQGVAPIIWPRRAAGSVPDAVGFAPMASNERRCAACGSRPQVGERVDCSDCGRPLGICDNRDCGWCVRLFESDDARDCLNCGYGWDPLPPEEEERRAVPLRRQMEAYAQMVQRSGSLYELARERSRIVTEAYRAAGRPRKVSLTRTHEGWQHMFHIGRGHESQAEPATKQDADAWYAWARQRDRLRRKLGGQRATGVAAREATPRQSGGLGSG